MEILGIKVDKITYQQALEKAREFIESGGEHYVVTPNPEIIVASQKDRELKEILNRADLAVPDGIGLVLASKLLGKPLPERVTGIDLVEGLAALAAEHGYSIFLLGGKEKVAEKAAIKLKTQNSKLKVNAAAGPLVGQDGKPVDSKGQKQEKEVIELINKFSPAVLVVAFGAPKQEKWIARNLPALNIKLAIGVGGALNYLAGQTPRAPQRIRRLGLEWFYRLIREPWRLKRQFALSRFVYLVLKERFNK